VKKLILFSVLCLSLCPVVPAAAGEYSPDSIMTFTRFLIGKREYYRALVELKRLQSYYPGFLSPAAGGVTELYLLSMGKQYRGILGMKTGSGDPAVKGAFAVFASDAAIALSDNARLGALITSWQYGADPFFDRCIKKRRLYLCLSSGQYEAAAALCGETTLPDLSACRELIGQARDGFRGGKKPWLAGVLGLVPGAGYLYSGEIATGIFAFLLIAADPILTYFAFRTHNEVIGYFTGVVGGLFYVGSIAGGYFAAQRCNVQRFETSRGYMADAMGLDRDRQEIFNRYGIGADGKP
jgi:hypothetical protein